MEGDIPVCSLASSSATSGPSVEKGLPDLSLLEAFAGLGGPRPSYTAQGSSRVAVEALASIPGCRERGPLFKIPSNDQR